MRRWESTAEIMGSVEAPTCIPASTSRRDAVHRFYGGWGGGGSWCPLGPAQLAWTLKKVDLVICKSSFNFLRHYNYKLRPSEATEERRYHFSAGIREVKKQIMREGHPQTERSGLEREVLFHESRTDEVNGSSETFSNVFLFLNLI